MTPLREMLPHRRSSSTFNFEHDGVRYVTTIGFYKDGRIGEVFVNSHKLGTGTDVFARDAAIILSIALQHAVPIETIRGAITRNVDGSPSGPMGKLLDALAADQG